MAESGSLSVPRGAALYVGALIGPGLLLVPALAAQAAGPASILAWALLLVLSAPLAITFAALGWWAVGSAANILMWLFIGWEAMAQLAGEFRDPASQLPRAMMLAFVVIATIYVGLAVATITVTAGTGSRVPLADLIGVGF